MSAGVDTIAELFASEGAGEYLGEAVTQAEHMLQAGALAEAAGLPPALVAAALLHDVGHFQGLVTGRDLMRGVDNHHSDTGAQWLGQWFGPDVCEPVRLHVAAKRYLCAVEPAYFAELSAASVHTLQVQGGPMSAEEVAIFRAGGHADQAVALRTCDEGAKDPTATTPPFDHFRPLLEALVSEENDERRPEGRRSTS
jgi:gamma-butyrobetaine dioxygenase